MRKKCHGLIVFVVCVGSVLLCYFLRRKYISKKDTLCDKMIEYSVLQHFWRLNRCIKERVDLYARGYSDEENNFKSYYPSIFYIIA